MKITIHNPVRSSVNVSEMRYIHPILSHDAIFYQKTRFTKERRMWRKPVYKRDGNKLYFYTGLVSRIVNKFPGTDLEILYDLDITLSSPHLKNLTIREDQSLLVESFIKSNMKRGLILAPTGSGKTVLQMAILSCLPKETNVLILAHTISLVKQLYDEFSKEFKNVMYIDGTTKNTPTQGIVVSTIQTYKNMVVEHNNYNAIIVDEAHHASSPSYEYVLNKIHAPIRLGFTATPPTDPEKILAIEGLLGPVIAQQTINEASKLEILAKPKIKIVKLPINEKVKKLRNYNDVIEYGILLNNKRNDSILEVVKKARNEKKTVLILVNKIEHGERLHQMCLQNQLLSSFVNGATESESREHTKRLLNNKTLDVVIVTSVWREGINIPSLNIIINAGGGKGEIPTIQAIGRGLRRTSDKEEVIIYDFFDPSHTYLIDHFGSRLCIYMENNWI